MRREFVRRMGVVTEKAQRLCTWVVVRGTSVTPLHKAGVSGRVGLHRRAGEKSLDLIQLAIGSHRMFYEQGSSMNRAVL